MTAAGRLELPARILHLSALAVTVGAPLFLAVVVAPASFRTLPTRDLAGALMSPIFARMCTWLEVGFVILLGTCWLLCRVGHVPRAARALLTRLPVLGVIGAAVIENLLLPSIDRIRAEAPGLIDNLPAADPSRLLLERYHRLATAFFAVELAAAVLMLVLTARFLFPRDGTPSVPSAPPAVPKLLDLSDASN
jgi:Domain of unknown function (DUF4149)